MGGPSCLHSPAARCASPPGALRFGSIAKSVRQRPDVARQMARPQQTEQRQAWAMQGDAAFCSPRVSSTTPHMFPTNVRSAHRSPDIVVPSFTGTHPPAAHDTKADHLLLTSPARSPTHPPLPPSPSYANTPPRPHIHHTNRLSPTQKPPNTTKRPTHPDTHILTSRAFNFSGHTPFDPPKERWSLL